MKVLILGTGAMAKRIGASLARLDASPDGHFRSDSRDRKAGHYRSLEVTLAGRWQAALDAISAEGIWVESPDTPAWNQHVRTMHLDEFMVDEAFSSSSAGYDLVLVLVKAYQTASVAEAAARAVRRDASGAVAGLILSLQNGLGNREILERVVGSDAIALGTTSAGATGLGPNRIRIGGQGRTILEQGQHTEAVGSLLQAASLPVEFSSDIRAILWNKLAINAAINPLTALHGILNGELLDDGPLQAQMMAAAREVGRVAKAKGIELDGDPADWAIEVAQKTAANRSSMLQDIERGAFTEIEAICGAAVREGRRLKVPTPVNSDLLERVLDMHPTPQTGLLSIPLRHSKENPPSAASQIEITCHEASADR